MNSVECTICFEKCRIPVRITCFPCGIDQDEQPSCHSITRVCMACARRYLELDRPPDERTEEKRCLTCQVVVKPRLLNEMNAYQKDYLLMTMDNTPNHRCIHPACDFEGNHMELDAHLRSDCMYRITQCVGCHNAVPHYLMDNHIRYSCQGYASCIQCAKRVLYVKMDAHLSEEHAILRCESCMAFVHRETPGMHAHRMDECPLRNVECRFCKACVTHSDLKMHYRVKLEALHAYLTTVHLQVDQLEKTKQQYLEYIGAVQAELKNCGE